MASTAGAIGTRGRSADEHDVSGRPASTDGTTAAPRGIIDRVKDGATTRLAAQKDRATEGLGSVAQAARKTTEALRAEHHDKAARFVEQAANRLERFSTNLRGKDITEIVDDAARLARRQPAIFLGLSFAAGLLTARFLKSSQERAQRDRLSPERSYGGGAGAASAERFSGREML